MKKNRIVFLIIILLIVSLFFIYKFTVNVFNPNTLKSISIVSENPQTPKKYELTPTDKKLLFSSLDTSKTPIDPSDIQEIFQITLVNKWNLTKQYQVAFLKNDGFALLDKEDQQFYPLLNPGFFMGFSGFDQLYSNLMPPDLSIMMGNTSYTLGEILGTWSYKRFDNSWEESSYSMQTDEALSPISVSSSSDTLKIISSKIPDQVFVEIIHMEDQRKVFSDFASTENIPMPETDGAYTYIIQLNWNQNTQAYKGNLAFDFDVVINRPAELKFSTKEVTQGAFIELELLYADVSDEITVVQNLIDTIDWYPSGGNLKALIPTNYFTQPGAYEFKFGDQIETVTVISRAFKVQQLTVSSSVTDTTSTDEAYAEYRANFTPVRKESHPERYFDTPFVLPTKGKITTEFGESRTVNGKPVAYRHAGLDIAAPLGTDVYATNTGKVVFAMELLLIGNTVIIDHGAGLFSVYEHMDELLVTKGQMVEVSEPIGKVGSTGFSTGAHLHFMISYYDTNLEPGYFIYGRAITKENYMELMQ